MSSLQKALVGFFKYIRIKCAQIVSLLIKTALKQIVRHARFQSQSHRARLPLLTFPQVAPARQSRNMLATAIRHQIFSGALMCRQPIILYILPRWGCGWVEGRKKKIYRFWKSYDIFPCLSILILHRRVGVRAGWLHMLHPLTAAHKVTFISPARIFSEVFFPARRLFLPEPFILGCVKHILFLVNCLSLSPSSILLRGLWMQVAPPPPVQGNVRLSRDWWLPFSGGFTKVPGLYMSERHRA